jgi:formylglycine-generating enzyme required for sulfatase activity/dienelactone hydrolase
MVRVRGGRVTVASAQRLAGDAVPLPDFLVGRYEVTNREFKTFVTAGGYQRKELWDLPVRDGAGAAMTWEAASARFRDRTGRLGPATWEAGDIPAGKEDFPVAGISWYEARAYARFAGRELPTIHHWRSAARIASTASPWMLPVSNVKGTGVARVGQFTGMTPFGAFDMAGNVREWCVNANGTQRYILGGSWQEDAYVFASAHSEDPLDRSETNGMRLIGLPSDSARATLTALSAPAPRGFRDYSRERPVGDAEFRTFLPVFDYDKTPLNAAIVATDTSDRRWVMQTVEFDAAYGQERVRAFMYLPRNTKPPYQTVLFYPGGSALDNREIAAAQGHAISFDFVVTTGRAVIFPIVKDTYDRKTESVNYATDPVYNMSGGLLGPNTYRDHTIMQVKDVRRALDYLATRSDIDTARLGYSGYSWGARLASINLAVERRFKVAALGLPGLMYAPRRPEVDEINFLPRVKTPTLIMSGRYDNTFTLETAVLPYVRWLGVPPADLRHRIYPTLHFLPRDEHIRETLDWFDKYLGSVTP